MIIGEVKNTTHITQKVALTEKENTVEKFQEALEKASKEQDDKELLEACKEVEQYMLTSIFKQMKASTKIGETLVEKGDYEEMFEDYLVEEQCKQMTEAGGIGLAKMMYEQMSKVQSQK